MSANNLTQRTLGPIINLETHLPSEWWKTLFNSLYLKTDGDVVENNENTKQEIDLLLKKLNLKKDDAILDLCCGQGRHVIELARREFQNITGIDRSRYLIRLARKRAAQLGLIVKFSEGDARKIRLSESSQDCVYLMGNSFGYFEREEDDVKVIKSIKRVLKPQGKLALDIVNGEWMKKNFESRSWEWIDQNQFVCRERSISNDSSRIISREVIVHAEKGVIADQFYAERLYIKDQISNLLKSLGFTNIEIDTELETNSTRNHDLGMMSNRLFITATAPLKKQIVTTQKKSNPILVLLGDPRLPDSVKKEGVFNQEDLETVDRLKSNLNKLTEYKFTYLDNHKHLLRQLQILKPSFVMNLCDEGYNNDASKELHIPSLLELLNIPYTGADPTCLSMCYNKSIVRAIASDLDIPVPEETYFAPSDQAASIPSIFPALLKPNYGDSSIGITQESVVYNAKQLISYLDKLQSNFPNVPILIQEFLEGAEYSVAIIGNKSNYKILPILEVNYKNLPSTLPQILSYESKWLPDSPYWTNIQYKKAKLSEENQRKLIDYSVKLFERTNCRDYARFDFRADKQGIIKLLEVNPNPGWCWDGKLNLMAGFDSLKYDELLNMILESAMDRSND